MTCESPAVLDPSIVAMVSLAANIAANHPKKGLCQLERLRGYGIPAAQIETVIDIARHIRDEAGQMLDAAFNVAAACCTADPSQESACCTPTAKGTACC